MTSSDNGETSSTGTWTQGTTTSRAVYVRGEDLGGGMQFGSTTRAKHGGMLLAGSSRVEFTERSATRGVVLRLYL
jgi:hypothetical protein